MNRASTGKAAGVKIFAGDGARAGVMAGVKIAAPVSPGIRRALDSARQALDPTLAENERRAVALCAALTAHSLFNALKRFQDDPVAAGTLRRRAELLVAELGALETLCGGGGRV